jgi:4-amino-4-deoxy-L-arabinose transferase-like glycosyltransferase
MEGHSGPIYYYIPVILIGLLPFTTVLIRAVSLFREQLKSSWARFLWMWFGFVFVFFSLADTKLQHYIIYGYVPLMVLMANSLNRLKRPWLLTLPAALFLVVMLFLQKIAMWSLPHITNQFAAIVVRSAMDKFGAGHQLVVGLILAGTIAVSLIPRWSIQLRAVALGCLFIPLAGDILQAPVKTAALLARQRNYDVTMWQMNYPSFHVYYGRPALRKKKLSPGDIIITKADKLGKIDSYEIIQAQHGIVLARINSLPTSSHSER